MAVRTLICFPTGDTPGLRAEAAQLALGLASRGVDVVALGALGAWRHALRLAGIRATDIDVVADPRRFTEILQELEPQILHAFGAEAAHAALPQTVLVGAGGVATLGHADLGRLNPTHFRTASAVFVHCDWLREQVARRLPATVPVVATEYLLPPREELPDTPNAFLAAELGIADGAPVVLLADYFHGAETEVARALLDATAAIAEKVPGVQVVIAGGGPRLAELEPVAQAVNEQLGRRAVLLPGHRDDMAQLLSLASVAVGSGRFAAEAIGAGVALVAAGAAGMIGTFTDDTARVCHFTCYGRHGRLEPLTTRALTTEIAGLFTYSQYRERFGADGQQVLLARGERGALAEQIVTYYGRSAPTGVITRTPQRITAVLPDDLRELLFCLPALGGLKEHLPLLQIRAVAAPRHQRFLERLGLVERMSVTPQSWREWPSYLWHAHDQRPDACLLFTGELAAAITGAATWAPHRFGFADASGSMLISDHLRTRATPSPARYLALAQALGVGAPGPVDPPSIPTKVRETTALSLLASGIEYEDPLILLCPDAAEGWAWPRSHWQALAALLAEERGEKVAVLHADGIELPDGVVPVMPISDSLVLASLVARASVVIAADSATLHMADLMGTPTIGIFGPTSPEICLPNARRQIVCHGEYPCHPCMENTCPERHCLEAVTPGEVLEAITQALAGEEIETSIL